LEEEVVVRRVVVGGGGVDLFPSAIHMLFDRKKNDDRVVAKIASYPARPGYRLDLVQ